MEKKLSVDGMSCMHCSGKVKKYLEANNAISNIVVDHEKNEALFSCDSSVNIDVIAKDITELGYPAKEK